MRLALRAVMSLARRAGGSRLNRKGGEMNERAESCAQPREEQRREEVLRWLGVQMQWERQLRRYQDAHAAQKNPTPTATELVPAVNVAARLHERQLDKPQLDKQRGAA